MRGRLAGDRRDDALAAARDQQPALGAAGQRRAADRWRCEEKGEKNELLDVIHEQALRIADVVRRLRQLKNPESVDYVGGTQMINLWKERADVTHFFGAHTIDNGGIHMAARRAGAAGMKALQIFTAIPKYYGDKSSIKPERVAALSRARSPKRTSSRRSSWRTPRTSSTRRRTRRRSTRARRPASPKSSSVPRARHRVDLLSSGRGDRRRSRSWRRSASRGRSCTRWTLCRTSTTRVLVENTAGAGRTFAKTAAEVGAILRHVPAALRRERATVSTPATCSRRATTCARQPTPCRACSMSSSRPRARPPAFFHLNDSEGALGSNKDRHTLIGEGQIGVEPFRQLVADRRSRRTFR